MGDGPVFVRVMTLLRHLLQVPFDRPAERGSNLHQHLISATETIPGAYLPGETATLRKDLEKLLTPYGFRNRNDNVRHGYCLGTAVLSPARLREVHNVVQQAASRLADPLAQDLLSELDERLGWAGISADGLPPVRSYARPPCGGRHPAGAPRLAGRTPPRRSDRGSNRGTPPRAAAALRRRGQLCR